MPNNPRPHISLPIQLSTAPAFVPKTGGEKSIVQPQDRQRQAGKLRGDLANVSTASETARAMQESIGWDSGFGLIVRFSSFPDIKLATESFDRSTDGIELLCVQKEGNEEYAVAWIPDGKLAIFEAKLVDYLGFRTIAGGKSRDSQRLIDSIREIRTAVIDDLWAGSTPIPDDNTDYKFEVWIGAPHLGGRRALTADNLSSRVDRFRSTDVPPP